MMNGAYMQITQIQGFEDKCTGCGACESVCSENAITMENDKEVFLFPKVDFKKCIQCGKCVNVCHILPKSKSEKTFNKKVYACQIKDRQMLLDATAGGFFPLLSKKVLEVGGVVYGCCWDSNMNAVHQGGETLDIIKRCSGSKYVQSDISNVFTEIYDYLKKGKLVLFSGTPCQVDAVQRYCEALDRSNLLTMDVPCYGVPSQALFSAYIEKLNKKYNAKVVDFRFRDKRHFGWSHTTRITFERQDGTFFEIEETDHKKIDYYKMFGLRDCYLLPCYQCKYNTINRISDFTTGNYWGIENTSKTFDTTLGVSMLIINNEKALRVFEEIKDGMILEERTIENAIECNDALVRGSVLPKYRDALYSCFSKNGFDVMFKRYYQLNFIKIFKALICKILKK